jgi:hypothetical protein
VLTPSSSDDLGLGPEHQAEQFGGGDDAFVVGLVGAGVAATTYSLPWLVFVDLIFVDLTYPGGVGKSRNKTAVIRLYDNSILFINNNHWTVGGIDD